jgi:hypothetical protein
MRKLITWWMVLLSCSVFAQNQKISEMTPAVSLSGVEYFPVLQSGVNKKATISQIPLQGDATGTILNVTVNKLRGFSYAATSPSSNQVYAFNTSTLRFEPVSISTLESDPQFTSLGVAKTLTITINGVAQDLSANRSWSVNTTDGDKGAIIVSSLGSVWLLDLNSVSSANIVDGSITNSDLANNTIAFGTGTGGLEPTWSASPISLGGTATINIPNANGSGVTRGLISKTDYDKIITAYGWGNHADANYLTSYTETDPLSPHLDQVYPDPDFVGTLDYAKIINWPPSAPQIIYKAGSNIVLSAGTGDTVIIASVAGGGGGGGSIVSVGLSAPTGMSGGSAVTGAGGTLNLTLTLGAGNVRSNGAGGFVIGNLDLATEGTGVLPAANGGLPTGDNGDITVATPTSWSIDANAVTTTKINNGAVTNAKLAFSTVGQTVTTASGTAPAYSSSTTALGASTELAIPMALNTGVTAGLISKADYDAFNAKQNAITYPGALGDIYFKAAGNAISSTSNLNYIASDGSGAQLLKITGQVAQNQSGLAIINDLGGIGSFVNTHSTYPGYGDIPAGTVTGLYSDNTNGLFVAAKFSGIDFYTSPSPALPIRRMSISSTGNIKVNKFTGTGVKMLYHDNAGEVRDTTFSLIGTGTGTVTAVSASEPPSTAINLEVTNPSTTPNVVLTYNGLNTHMILADGSTALIPTTSIADGDKGDIVVSGSGSVWSVQNSTITNAKLLNPSFLTTIGTSGLQPNFGASYATLGAGFTLNIPLAATASVLAGTISKAQYDRFNSAAYDVGGILYTTNAEGASITSGILNMHHATSTSAGVVTTTNQTWEGRKTLVKPLRLPLRGTSTFDGAILFGSANDDFAIGVNGPGDHSGSEQLFFKSGAGVNDYMYMSGGNLNVTNGSVNTDGVLSGNVQTQTFSPNVTDITSNHTITDGEMILLVDATSGSVTVEIPNTYIGLHVTVKKIDASINTVTIDPEGSIEVEFATTSVLVTQGQTLVIVKGDSGDWYKIN